MEFTWKPGTDCPPQNHGFAGSYLSGAYIHLFYGTEYGTQINEFLVGEQNPLTGEVSVSKVLRDPASLQALSPFDLSAPERYVLSGFRERLR